MHYSQEPTFSFKNLQPINYLKNFNKLIDYCQRSSLIKQKNNELKTVSLSKFPLPQYYYKMEGIFENINKKRIEQQDPKKARQKQQEQQFMRNHKVFMKNVLEKFVKHNQNRQESYQNQKQFYKINFSSKSHTRNLSEPKLFSIRPEKKLAENSQEPEYSLVAKASKGSTDPSISGQKQQEEKQVLPKLQPRKKKQTIKVRKSQQIEEYLLSRKVDMNIQGTSREKKREESIRENLSRESAKGKTEQKLQFSEEIIRLQSKQAKKQKDFGDKISRQIDNFHKKMSIQVHAINYYSFW